MGSLLWNLLLAFTWAALLGEITLLNVFVGFVIGLFALRIAHGTSVRDDYHERMLGLMKLSVFLLKELVVSNFRLAFDVITPSARSSPGIVAYPLEARTDAEITFLVMVMSYIPGTQAVDVSDDRQTLYIHGMFVEDRDAFCLHIKETLERPLLAVLR